MIKFQYNATVIQVHDGDTLHLNVDLNRAMRTKDQTLGFHIYVEAGRLHLHERFRLADINAPELPTPAGVAATDYFKMLLGGEGSYKPLVIRTVPVAGVDAQEKYGRWLAHLWLQGEDLKSPSINDRMVAAGQAVPFMVT